MRKRVCEAFPKTDTSGSEEVQEAEFEAGRVTVVASCVDL
jgi:hypothetical protein